MLVPNASCTQLSCLSIMYGNIELFTDLGDTPAGESKTPLSRHSARQSHVVNVCLLHGTPALFVFPAHCLVGLLHRARILGVRTPRVSTTC